MIQAGGIQANQIYIHILRLGRGALVTCPLVINATRRGFRLCQYFVHKKRALGELIMPYRFTTNIVIALTCYLAFAVPVSPQTQKPLMVGAENNETSKANLDYLAEAGGKDKIIIFIGRLGTGERSRTLNRARLQVALKAKKFQGKDA